MTNDPTGEPRLSVTPAPLAEAKLRMLNVSLTAGVKPSTTSSDPPLIVKLPSTSSTSYWLSAVVPSISISSEPLVCR